MLRSDFHFELPEELIAQKPPERRGDSRLLVVEGDRLHDLRFNDITRWLHADDLLVFNDTRVIPARLYGYKTSGGKVEVLIERIIDEQRALAHVRASRAPKANDSLLLENAIKATVLGRRGDLFDLDFSAGQPLLDLLDQYGHIPLPPYIGRADNTEDKERYQTVFARRPGAVAAPTAGLHFDKALLETLAQQGVEMAFITLHVGAGTFQPVRSERVEAHRMHSELVTVSAEVCERIRATHKRGGRVVAVGTTVVRSLESACQQNHAIRPLSGETDIFIYPGYTFRCVDAMITNFHLPESTLLMLVAAFAGYDRILRAYHHAIAERYRFFSYGDAMFMIKGDH